METKKYILYQIFLFILVSTTPFYPLASFASSLEFEYSRSETAQSTEITAEGEFDSPEDGTSKLVSDSIYDWNFGFVRTVSSSSVNSITDTTNHLEGGLGLITPSHWSFGGDLIAETTPEENLRAFGPDLSVGWKKDLASKQEGRSFIPNLSLRLDLQELDYVQDLKTGKRRTGQITASSNAGTNSITQRSTSLNVRWKPLEWLRMKIGYTKYFYNRDVKEFAQYLDSGPIASNSSAGLNSALSGFYDHTLKTGLNFYPDEKWEIEVSHSKSYVLLDDSTTTSMQLNLYREFFRDYRAGLGLSKSTSTNPSTGSSTSAMASLEYDF